MKQSGKRNKQSVPRIALLIESSLASGRDILRGIARYVREHGAWSLYYEPRSLRECASIWLRDWKGDGVIARVQDAQFGAWLAENRIPAVDVLGGAASKDVPVVQVDDRAIGRLASEHLLARGFRHFGFVGLIGERWALNRGRHFAAAIRAAGFACQACEVSRFCRDQRAWEAQAKILARWIVRLPKPAGVMVSADELGPELLEACRCVKVPVPDEVAVIGVDNDEPLCEVSNPPLSSVWPSHFQVGYQAAALLDRLLRGAAVPKEPLLVPPSGVVTRQSTDVLAVEDPALARALRFIREHACEPITINDVVTHAPVSRSVLQRRFRKVLRRTVHEEILRLRLRRARQLITETDLPYIDIAEQAGFRHPEYLSVVFKSHLGRTPAQYRKAARVWRKSRFQS